jgi:hypothetical protein
MRTPKEPNTGTRRINAMAAAVSPLVAVRMTGSCYDRHDERDEKGEVVRLGLHAKPGDVIEVDAAEAARLVAAGVAERA